MGELDGRIAVITGGSKGIGATIARALAAAGSDCVLAARTEADLESTARSIASDTGQRVEWVAGDLREIDGCRELHDRVVSSFGRTDILVNNAGATKAGSFLDLADEDWTDGFALKFYAAVRLSRLFWPQLVESSGTVVNVVGGLARSPAPDFMIGGAVNAACWNFNKALAGQGLQDDVNVNAVLPGQTRTERHKEMMERRAEVAGVTPEEFEARIVSGRGVRRLGEPEDVASLALYLCLPSSRHIQGTAIAVDGGATPGLY